MIPLAWILLSRLLEEAAATQLRNTLPAMAILVEPDLSLESEELQHRILDVAREDQLRVTVIDDAGFVLADSSRSWGQVQGMEDHSTRPEIIAAREAGEGTAVRHSSTTDLDYVYVAKAIANAEGRIFYLRLAQPIRGLGVLRRDLLLVIVVVTVAALAGMSGWVWWVQRRVSRAVPELLESARAMESGDFSCRIETSRQTDLGRLGRFFNTIASQAESQIRNLEEHRGHLLTVVSKMREGVLVTDAEGFTQLANPAFRRLFGIQGEVDHRTPLELTQQTELENLIVTTLTKGEPQLLEIELGGTSQKTIAISTTSLGEDAGAVVVARDISDSILLGQMRRDFVANVSHELKTPLTAIRGYAETLRYGEMDEEEVGQLFLDRILQQCRRLQVVLEDLLTLSQLESLGDQAERNRIPFDDLLGDCLDSIAPQAAEKRVELQVDSRPTPGFYGDRKALERLVINLLDNAVKYNRVGGKVTVRSEARDGEVILEVADTGIGIPSNMLSRVFERFYRVDKGRSRDEGGTGLGLAIVKHVAQLHRGRVEVESRLGEGSVFRVHLPTQSV